MFERVYVRLLDHVFHNRFSPLTFGATIFGVALAASVGVGLIGLLDKAPPERLEPFPIARIYPSELAQMRAEQPILASGLPVMSAPLWDVPSDHLFELPNRDAVNTQIATLRTAAVQVEWPCERDNDQLEAVIDGLGGVDGGAGRDNSAVFYHRAVAASLNCAWGQAERDFDALEGLLNEAQGRRPPNGWENSEPRFWAVRAAARYLRGDLELRRADAEELEGDARREAAERALAHFRAADTYLRSGDMAAVPRTERTQPFPTTNADTALLELDSADIVNQMAVAALVGDMDLGQAWSELFGGYVDDQAALSERPVLGLNLQMLALVQGRRRESRIFQPSPDAFDSLGDAAPDLRSLSASLGNMAGRRGVDRSSHWNRIASWRESFAVEDGNPAVVIRDFSEIATANPHRDFYRTFLREVAAGPADQPSQARDAFRDALPREVRGDSWTWLKVLLFGILFAGLIAAFVWMIHATAQPLYGRAHYRDRDKAGA